MLTLGFLLLACSTHREVSQPASDAANPNKGELHRKINGQTFPLIRDLVCSQDVCTLETADGIHPLNLDDLTLGPVSGPGSAEDPFPEYNPDPPDLEARWNQLIANKWRSPFQNQVPTPTGGRMKYTRGLEPGTSRVMRTGGGLSTRLAPDAGTVAYPRTLALHPTGREAYLVVWPNQALTAFDPRSMQTVWRLELGAPAIGLFVSSDGLHMVAETGGTIPEEQMLDFDTGTLQVPDGVDPTGDPHLRRIERPSARATVVVSLPGRMVVARLPGPYLRWHPLSDGSTLVATDKALARIPPPYQP